MILVFALAIMSLCNAQKIEVKKVFGAHVYYQNGDKMKMKDLAKVMESNSEALNFIKKAKSKLLQIKTELVYQ